MSPIRDPYPLGFPTPIARSLYAFSAPTEGVFALASFEIRYLAIVLDWDAWILPDGFGGYLTESRNGRRLNHPTLASAINAAKYWIDPVTHR